MTTSTLDLVSTETPRRARSPKHQLLSRVPGAVLGLLGAGLLVYGVTQPWVSTFAGLLTQSGWGTRNGMFLVAGAVAGASLAVTQVFAATTAMRWLLGAVGFATLAFTGYLLIQLYRVDASTDSMVVLGKGPGLYYCAGGAFLLFATIFLPMPSIDSADSGFVRGSERSGRLAISDESTAKARPTAWSRLRYPAALLAVVAGLAHVPVTPSHLNEAPYIGGLFIAFTAAAILLAAALLVFDAPLVWAGLGGSCLLAVVAYVLSRTVGLPLMGDDVGNWFESLGVVSVLTETAVVGLASAVLVSRLRRTTTGS